MDSSIENYETLSGITVEVPLRDTQPIGSPAVRRARVDNQGPKWYIWFFCLYKG
jgi:hypothetical protein